MKTKLEVNLAFDQAEADFTKAEADFTKAEADFIKAEANMQLSNTAMRKARAYWLKAIKDMQLKAEIAIQKADAIRQKAKEVFRFPF